MVSRVTRFLRDNPGWYMFFVITIEVFFLETLHFIVLPHLRDSSNILPFFEPNDALTRTAAIIASAAALLLSGVIIMAPLLSLSLHQSYDTLFELRKHLKGKYEQGIDHCNLISEVDERLRDQLRWYQRLNPVYLGTWITSVAVLGFVVITLLRNNWSIREIFYDAVSFMLVSCVLSVLFSFVAIAFFSITRPGITKLDLFIKYFDDEERIERERQLVDSNKNTSAVTNNVNIPNPTSPNQGKIAVTRGRHAVHVGSFGAIIVALLLAAVFFWVKSGKDDITVAYNSTAIASAPVFVAIDSDVGNAHHLKINRKPNATGRLALDALLGGQADVATVADVPVINGSLQRQDLRIILTICESPIEIVARKSKIRSIADLKGKKIGTFNGTSARYFLLRELALAGISEKQVTIVSFPTVSDVVPALQNDSVDAISSWEPQAQFAMDLLGGDAKSFEDRQTYVERFNLVTTEEDLSNPRKRQKIEEFVRTVIDASQRINDRPADAKMVVSRDLGMEPQQLANVWSKFSFPSNVDYDDLLDSLSNIEQINAAGDNRTPRTKDELKALIDVSIWKEISNDKSGK